MSTWWNSTTNEWHVEDERKPNTHTQAGSSLIFIHFSASKYLSDKIIFHRNSFIFAPNQRRITHTHQYSTMERNQKFQFTNKSLRTNENREQKKQFALHCPLDELLSSQLLILIAWPNLMTATEGDLFKSFTFYISRISFILTISTTCS